MGTPIYPFPSRAIFLLSVPIRPRGISSGAVYTFDLSAHINSKQSTSGFKYFHHPDRSGKSANWYNRGFLHCHGSGCKYHFFLLLVAGAGDGNNSLFTLESNGTLKTAAILDFETSPSLSIRVRVKDDENASLEGQFLVTVTDANYPPEGHLHLLGQVEVGQQVIIDHNISDQDGDGNLTFSWFRNGQPLTRAEVLSASTSQFFPQYCSHPMMLNYTSPILRVIHYGFTNGI